MYAYQDRVPVLAALGESESVPACPGGMVRGSSGFCVGGPPAVAAGEARLRIVEIAAVGIPAVAALGLLATNHRRGAVAASVVTGVALIGVLAWRPLFKAAWGP